MSLASSLSKLSFCRRIARTPNTFLRLVLHSKAAARPGADVTPRQKGEATEYLLKLANAPHPTALRPYAGDLKILYEIFWQQSYDLPQLRAGVFRTIVDVGANVGLAALFFLQKFPVSRLVCVEPEPANFRLLQSNLRGTPAVLRQAALSATDGTVKIDSSPQAYNAKVSAETGTVEVAAISMDTLLQSQGLSWVDLLKIDIEDYEQEVFAGPVDWLKQVGTLLIEIHSPASYAAVRRAVQAQGFTWEQATGKPVDSGLFVARNPKIATGQA
ncbi:FkbM family methyltransferase [Hymenobacter sp. BT664]|uniref:FkbM family methyltransferase n=1 Tax=Hymenobacter montanus TaxID=2771359 RepID=A0A927BI90_9BACT|nr:FkbM family methyltransferase [Hymenobacter montanus]MBD2770538.1 FkbM family methyltransferase [Hymenobacter montanus]